MAEQQNLVYEQINWGWLNDYAGYKFAPITFYEQLYTSDGRAFKNMFNDTLDDLRDGTFVVGASQRLVQENEDGTYSPYNPGMNLPNGEASAYSEFKPIYFLDGKPSVNPYLNIDSNGHINIAHEQDEYGIYYPKNRQGNNEEILNDTWGNSILPVDGYNNYTIYGGYIYGDKIISRNTNETNYTYINAGNITNTGDITNSGNILNTGNITANIITATNKFVGNLQGNADTATRLQNTSKIGDINLPVYFNNGQPVTCTRPTLDSKWTGVVYVASSSNSKEGGLMEIGKYIDFHSVSSATDYTTRLYCNNSTVDSNGQGVQIQLPTQTGQLALITDTVDYANQIKVTRIVNDDLTSESQYYLTAVNSYTTGQKDLYTRSDIYITEEEGKDGSAILMGAAWNDYAEYRTQIQKVEPGYCVISNDKGEVSKTNQHLSPCDGIVSDTFGFAIGKTNTYQTPLAVAGRVLAHCEGNRYNYHAGDVVCASENGKVVKMTREEIKEYPDRIVGTVSEIPEYEKWNNKLINGRIWIKVK